jgi:hypothetical protein
MTLLRWNRGHSRPGRGFLECLTPVSGSRLDVSLAPNQRCELLAWRNSWLQVRDRKVR